jgi:hypothetical protein
MRAQNLVYPPQSRNLKSKSRGGKEKVIGFFMSPRGDGELLLSKPIDLCCFLDDHVSLPKSI